MKNLMITCVAIFSLCACKKEMTTPTGPSDTKVKNTSSFNLFTIPAGKQYCDKSSFTPVKTKQLAFKVIFDSSAIYHTILPENQYDINKLFGFSDNNSPHQQFSARFGWRWSDSALRLFAYDYNNGNRDYKELGIVNIGKEINCSIKVSGDTYIFSLDGRETNMPRASTTSLAEGYQLYPYFGGDEHAPHEVKILMKPIAADSSEY